MVDNRKEGRDIRKWGAGQQRKTLEIIEQGKEKGKDELLGCDGTWEKGEDKL